MNFEDYVIWAGIELHIDARAENGKPLRYDFPLPATVKGILNNPALCGYTQWSGIGSVPTCPFAYALLADWVEENQDLLTATEVSGQKIEWPTVLRALRNKTGSTPNQS